MSIKHPIIAVTGSSGSGTTSVKKIFDGIFGREKINAVSIEGDSFHRYDRAGINAAMAEAERSGNAHFSHFGPEANLVGELEALFRQYSASGTGQVRRYLHSVEEAQPHGQAAGTFTPWAPLDAGSDLLFYEGLHGGVKTDAVDVAQHVDLLIGVTPIVNLEWIQKINRDTKERGYQLEDVQRTILRRMHDYVHYITPQFSRTHINFQRVPTVDTSNPFVACDTPTPEESFVVIRFSDPKGVDFSDLLSKVNSSFMSRPDCVVVPGGEMGAAMQLILTPMILRLLERRTR